MEFINHIELAGVVGSVRKQKVSDRMVANMTVVTEYCYNDKSGGAVIETTWHNVIAWQNATTLELETIERGSHGNVHGRLRARRYTDSNGESHIAYEIIAASVRVLPNE